MGVITGVYVTSVFLHAGVVIGGGDDVEGGGRKVEHRFLFSKSVSDGTEKARDKHKYFHLDIFTFIYLYCRRARLYFDLACILTPPTDPPKYKTTRKNTLQYFTPKHLLRYTDSRIIIYQQQQQEQYNQISL